MEEKWSEVKWSRKMLAKREEARGIVVVSAKKLPLLFLLSLGFKLDWQLKTHLFFASRFSFLVAVDVQNSLTFDTCDLSSTFKITWIDFLSLSLSVSRLRLNWPACCFGLLKCTCCWRLGSKLRILFCDLWMILLMCPSIHFLRLTNGQKTSPAFHSVLVYVTFWQTLALKCRKIWTDEIHFISTNLSYDWLSVLY